MDLNEKLLNVRRATRLLAAYNRRILSIAAAVDREAGVLPEARLEFVEWRPSHHRAIGNQTTWPFDRWGWDFLPLMDAWFWWTTDRKRSPAGRGAVSVCLWHVSDSGYRAGGGEPDPAAFEPAEQSTTTIAILIYALAAGRCRASWQEIYDHFVTAEVDLTGVVRAVPTDGLAGAEARTVIRYVGWRVSMADLATETDVEARLLKPLRDHVAALAAPQ